MKISEKDRYEHKLMEMNKRLIMECKGKLITLNDWKLIQEKLLKEYGFNEDDWCHLIKMLGQSKCGTKKHRASREFGWKRYVIDKKEQEKIKSENREQSGKQEHLNEVGEEEIKYEDNWIGDVSDEYLGYEHWLEVKDNN